MGIWNRMLNDNILDWMWESKAIPNMRAIIIIYVIYNKLYLYV